MKRIFHFFAPISLLLIFTGCTDYGDNENPLNGKSFRDIQELPEMKNFTHSAGSVIDAGKTPDGDYKFAIGHYRSNDLDICVFEEILSANKDGQVSYKILDTINIGKVNDNEYLTFCNCWQDSTWDSEIIAVVVADNDKEVFDEIVRAWRADIGTGKISVITNTRGITCANEGYGLEGCGEEDSYEVNESQQDISIDTLKVNDTLEIKSASKDTLN